MLRCMLGPLRSKYQLSLLAKMEGEAPLAEYTGASSGSLERILVYSSQRDPENTAVSVPVILSTGTPAVVYVSKS